MTTLAPGKSCSRRSKSLSVETRTNSAKIWRHAGRTGLSYSDHYEEKELFEGLMDRLRWIVSRAEGHMPVMVPALR